MYALRASFLTSPEMDAAVDGLEIQFPSAAADRPAKMLSAHRPKYGQLKIGRNVAADGTRFNGAICFGRKVNRNSAVDRLEIQRPGPIRICQLRTDVTVDGFGLRITAGRNIDTAVDGMRLDVAGQSERTYFTVHRAADQVHLCRHTDLESDFYIIVANVHPAVSLSWLTSIRLARIVTRINGADRHAAGMLDNLDAYLRRVTRRPVLIAVTSS